MPCSLKRKDVSRIVLEHIRMSHDDESMQESTRFWAPPHYIDHTARQAYFLAIRRKIRKQRCSMKGVKPSQFANAKMIKGIVDLVWKAVKASQEREGSAKKKATASKWKKKRR